MRIIFINGPKTLLHRGTIMNLEDRVDAYIVSPREDLKSQIVAALSSKQIGNFNTVSRPSLSSFEKEVALKDRPFVTILDLDCLSGDQTPWGFISKFKRSHPKASVILMAGTHLRVKDYISAGADGYLDATRKTDSRQALVLDDEFDKLKEWSSSFGGHVTRAIHTDIRNKLRKQSPEMEHRLRAVWPTTFFNPGRNLCVLKKIQGKKKGNKRPGLESDVYNLFKVWWKECDACPGVRGESISEETFASDFVGSDFTQFGVNHLGNEISKLDNLEEVLKEVSSITGTMFRTGIMPFIELCRGQGIVPSTGEFSYLDVPKVLQYKLPEYRGRTFPITVMDQGYLRNKLYIWGRKFLQHVRKDTGKVNKGKKKLSDLLNRVGENDDLVGWYFMFAHGIVHRDLVPTNIVETQSSLTKYRHKIIDLDVGWGPSIFNLSFLTVPAVVNFYENIPNGDKKRLSDQKKSFESHNTALSEPSPIGGPSTLLIPSVTDMQKIFPYVAIPQTLGRIGYIVDNFDPKDNVPKYESMLNEEYKTLKTFIRDSANISSDKNTKNVVAFLEEELNTYLERIK
jgi:hypothetical protein